MVRRPSVAVVRSQFQTSSSRKLLGQSKLNFMRRLLGKGRKKDYINGPGHMTKMAAMPIYGKNLKYLLLQNLKSYDHETWHVVSWTQALQSFFFINDVPELTLTYFTAKSNLVIWAFPWEKVKTVDFSETIAARDLKVGRSRHLIEFMKVCEY